MRRDHLPSPIPLSSLITHPHHVQTHTRDRACAQLHNDKEETMQIPLVESGTPASALHQGEEEINISHRDEEKGCWS